MSGAPSPLRRAAVSPRLAAAVAGLVAAIALVAERLAGHHPVFGLDGVVGFYPVLGAGAVLALAGLGLLVRLVLIGRGEGGDDA